MCVFMAPLVNGEKSDLTGALSLMGGGGDGEGMGWKDGAVDNSLERAIGINYGGRRERLLIFILAIFVCEFF